ncbi:hypothetical protein [Sphingomonas sp. KR3-1]|uniref:hypothetical protein n=1 Tax=Sphingomonas sp. KR3-1 TaxID=3156611 RepID=UPI0032B3A3A5
MTEIRPEDAAAALRSIDSARQHGAALRRYAGTASTVMVWGVIWLVCNLLSQFFPWGPKSWLIGTPLGVLWSILHPLPRREGAGIDLRASLSIFAGFGILWLMMLIARPQLDARSVNALISLLVALAYLITGIWAGMRLALVGTALVLAVCLGWFVFPAWLFLWVGIGGGGALILGGMWLRRA